MFGIGVTGTSPLQTKKPDFYGVCFGFSVGGFQRGIWVQWIWVQPLLWGPQGSLCSHPQEKLSFQSLSRVKEKVSVTKQVSKPHWVFFIFVSLSECGLRPQSVQSCSKCHSWGTAPLHLKASPCLPTGTVGICLQEPQLSWKTRYSKMDVD